jgi:hypothetical protein
VIATLATGVVIAALGFPLGWLWSSISPWLPVQVSNGALFYAEPEGNQSAAQESWYVLISIGAGVILAILVWVLLRRFRGPLMMVALALGGLASGWIMWRFGRSIGRAHARDVARSAADGATIKIPVDIRIQRNGLWHGFLPYVAGSLVYLAIAAIAVYAIIAGFTSYPDLIGRKRSRTPASEATPADGPIWPGAATSSGVPPTGVPAELASPDPASSNDVGHAADRDSTKEGETTAEPDARERPDRG